MAREIGNVATANIISMGIVAARTGIVTPEAAKYALSKFFASKSEKIIEMNHRAFDLGWKQ